MNLVILAQMIRLSRIIKEEREIRGKLNIISNQTNYFVVSGNNSAVLVQSTRDSITNCLYTEQYLRESVRNSCKCLDGFNSQTMDPIDYVSSSDVRNKFIDICHNGKIVATINLTTGVIEELKPEHDDG